VLALLTFLELLGRASLVATLLVVPRDARAAIAIAIVAGVANALRALVRGDVLAHETRRAWGELLDGIEASDLEALSDHRARPDGVTVLVDSVSEVAHVRAAITPELAGQAITLVAVVVFAIVRVPLPWLGVGAALALPVALLMRQSQRAQRRAQERTVGVLNRVARDVRALVEAGLELRAHGAERALDGEVRADVGEMARFERRVQRLSAASAVLPAAIALGLAIVPRRWLEDLASSAGWIDIGVIGAAALTLGLGIARGFEALAHAAPYRAAFARLAAPARREASPLAVPPERLDALQLARVSVIYEGAIHATPNELDLELARGGVALVGPNGSGKSSAILAALGFVRCARGSVLANGSPLTAERFAWLRARVAYVPQRCFVSPADSLAWHAKLAGVSDGARLLEGCEAMGLAEALRARGGAAALDAAIGTFSGGERQRFMIARALARRADLLVLDEPEVGLDARGRELLLRVLEREATERAVLVVAHDPSVVPSSFRRVACERSP
jgi:ABC-type transport system involved in cytochrome bd biosynthesis fused ATPase/permease subunit